MARRTRPDVRFDLVDHLRRALKRGGVVEGYRFICRRKGCGFEELRSAAEEARWPQVQHAALGSHEDQRSHDQGVQARPHRTHRTRLLPVVLL